MLKVHAANTAHLSQVMQWLKAEQDETGEGFYCNRNIVAHSFANGEGLCAIEEEVVLGFSVFQMFTDGGGVQIVKVRPSSRGKGLGKLLLTETLATLRQLGAKYADAECTSPEGEALCRSHGFDDYMDPRNYRRKSANPTLRLYFSDWRPPVRHPYA